MFGLGLQAVVQLVTHALVGRRALLLAMCIPPLTRSSYITHEAPRLALACLVPAALVIALTRLLRALAGAGRRPSTGTARPLRRRSGGSSVVLAVHSARAARRLPRGFQCLPPDILWINGTGAPLLYALGLREQQAEGAARRRPRGAPRRPPGPS